MKSTKPQLWVETNRWLLYFFATKNPLTAIWFVAPIILFWLTRIDFSQTSLIETISFILFGVLQWTFLEYLIHRFIFHWRPKNRIIKNAVESIHIYHHQNPEDQGVITSGPVFAIFWSIINYSFIYLIVRNENISALIMLGLTSSYYAYEWVHYLVHHKNFSSGIMKYLQDYHFIHHDKWAGNYGQTSPLWDIVFNTKLSSNKIQPRKKEKYIFSYMTKDLIPSLRPLHRLDNP